MYRLMLQLALLLVTCSAFADDNAAARLEHAKKLVQQSALVDTHIDVPYRLLKNWEDVTAATAEGDFDYPRARAGGLDVSFMSIYTKAELEAEGGSYGMANRLIDHVEAIAARAPERFMLVDSVASAEQAFASGRVGLAMGMENGSPLDGKLENVRHFYDRGVRYITLTHSLSNHISDSSYDEQRQWQGLSPFGREVVTEMNRVGVMVDISHVSDQAFWQVLEVSKVPVIASHSSVRHFTPGFERNMSDDMIEALARAGGVIMINFGSSFVTAVANQWSADKDKVQDAWLQSNGVEKGSAEEEAFEEQYREQHPPPYATLSDVADHFDHVVKLAGVNHLGIGSDFDGVGDSLPVGLKDVGAYPGLVAELLKRGWSDEDIGKILGGNLFRVWRAVEAGAE
jgi:membrane dipeptidase